MPNIQRAALYIRVSTMDQIEFSPDAQTSALREYAKKNKMIILDEHIYIDEGISGRRAEKRPAFQAMIKSAKQKNRVFDVILVHKFDRFARSREDSVVYKSLLRKECGIKVVSITEQLEDDKFSIILESMLEAMAEYYSLNLADEVKKGMTEKAKRGGLQCSPSFGYRVEENTLVINPEESKIVKTRI
jgi:site-specific DNA recombinase